MRPAPEKYKELSKLLANLDHESGVVKVLMEEVERPRKKRTVVNVYELNRLAKDGDSVLVLGKLLGAGELKRRLTVVAMDFSESAYQKVQRSGGRAWYLIDYIKEGAPDLSKMKLIR